MKRLVLAACLVVFMRVDPGLALDQARSIGQFHHTSWTEIDGHSLGVWAMAQTRDGFLWLGTSYGLFRFDGVRFERYQPLHGQLYGLDITALRALPSGDLWIGYQKGGVSVLRNGNLTTYTPSQGGPTILVMAIANDLDGNIWVAGPEGLLRFDGHHWQRTSLESNAPDEQVRDVALERDGTIWVSTDNATYFLRRGSKRVESFSHDVDDHFATSSDGRMWVANPTTQHFRPITMGRSMPVATGGTYPSDARNSAMAVVDKDGSLWMTSLSRGLVRIVHPEAPRTATVQRAGFKDGLTSDKVKSLLEDREGNIWVGTNLGLDRFREANVVAETALPQSPFLGFRTAMSDSALYVAGGGELFRIQSDLTQSSLGRIGLVGSMFADSQGVLWFAGPTGLSKWDGTRLEPVTLPAAIAGSEVDQIAETADHRLWIFVFGKGVYRQNGQAWERIRTRSDADPDGMQYDGRDIWFRYPDGCLQYANGGSITSFSKAQSGMVGAVEVFYRTTRGVLIGGERGIALFDGKRFRLLGTDRVKPLALTSGIAETPDGDVWVNSIVGVLRMRADEFYRAFDHPDYTPKFELFDAHDGLSGSAQQDEYQNSARLGPGGRIWIATGRTIAWIDPRNLHTNALPPPVVIRSLTSEDVAYPAAGELTLPAGADNVQIDYTALSLTDAARVRFRYRLDGFDKAWVEPGDRRQAFYTNLAPGTYHFRVLASNNSGVWNLTGASLAFIVTPTFVQSDVFLLLCILSGTFVLWVLYSWRLNQVSQRLRRSLHDRLMERERIARELHDTLLQGFHGLILRFQVVADRIPANEPVKGLAEGALQAADRVMVEGRDRVRDLRGMTPAHLTDAFAQLAEQLNTDASIEFRLTEDGDQGPLHPVVLDEVTRIGCEAITNAFRHARPKNVSVSIVYGSRQFVLSVRDDGIGMSENIVQSGREGHFGMTGMRERAEKVRASLSVSSRSGAGTRVDLTMPARLAYAPATRRPLLLRSILTEES